jgi:hypothetical protein
MASPPDGCSPFSLSEDGRYNKAIVFVERGGCYFNHKVVHAQRVGAVAVVVINHPHEKSLFQPDIDQKARDFQPEPTTIPLVMIRYKQADMILRHNLNMNSGRKATGKPPRFAMYGNYPSSSSSSGHHHHHHRKYHHIQDVPPSRQPFELMVRFSRGSFDLNKGTPGRVGNPRSKGRAVRITKRIPFAALYNHTTMRIPLERKKLCPVCHGTGKFLLLL